MKILILLPTMCYSSAARQVRLLVPELRRAGDEVQVATLGLPGPLADGLDVVALGRHPQSQPQTIWRLRKLVFERRPDVVHAWRMPAIRTASLALKSLRQSPRLIAGEADRGARLPLLDDRLVRTAAVADLPLAVAPPPPAPAFERQPESRLVMCAGNLTTDHGFRDSIWAFDMLKYLAPNLTLAIVGDGPEQRRLVEFTRRVARDDMRVQFYPARPDVPALLQHASVVWVPSLANCGRQVLLEAQAAGRPVIATRVPRLDSMIVDGENGLLVPAREPAALAAATQRLLADSALSARIGSGGRETAARAAPDRVAEAWLNAYGNGS